LVGGTEDDSFEGWYILITSGTNNGEERRILQSRWNNNTLTAQEAFTGQVATSVTYELHRIRPKLKHNAINRALSELSTAVPLELIDETLRVDNLLANWDFETFSTTFTGWTNTGTPTLSQNSTNVMHGTYAANIVASGADEGIYQTVIPNAESLTGKGVTFGCMVRATAADTARIRLLWGSSSYESNAYHTGEDEYQFQQISTAIPSTATEVTAVLEVANGGTAQFDSAYLYVDPIYKYTIPATFVRGPNYVYLQADREEPNGNYLILPRDGRLIPGRIIRLRGRGILTQPSTDAETTEIGDPHVSIVVAYALMFLNRLFLTNSSVVNRDRFATDMTMWGQEAASLIKELHKPKIGARRSDGTCHIDEDASGRYLVFEKTH